MRLLSSDSSELPLLHGRITALEADIARLRAATAAQRDEQARERLRVEQKALGQKRILEMVATGTPLPDTLDALIRLIELQEPGMRAGILVVTEAGGHIAFGHSPTLPKSFYAALGGLPITPPYLGSCGEAAHTLKPIAVSDVAAETRYSDAWRDNLLSYGIHAVRSTPIRSSQGRVLGSFAMHYDRPRDPDPADPELIDMATHLAAIALEHDRTLRALSDNEARFRAMADNIPQLAWMAQPDGWIFWYNRRWHDYTGTTLEEMQGWGWQTVHDPAHVDRVTERFRHALQVGEPWEDTFPLRAADGTYRWFLSRAMPVRGADGQIELWFGTNTDITERMRAEMHRELLVNELNHRVKNTLAVVQAMAAQTLRTRAEPGAWEDYQNRLLALSSAHDLLTRENWESAELGDIARQALHPYTSGGLAPRIVVAGPSVRLDPKSALSLVMGLHELATNAAKYGALSAAAGRITLTWTVADERLAVVWRESGGPAVTPPQRRGFGTRLIERGMAHELGADVRLSYDPDGVACEIVMPQQRGRKTAA